jgi:phage-related minor tail protein
VEWIVQFVMGAIGVITSSLTGNRNSWVQLYRALTSFRSGAAQFIVAVSGTLAWLRNYWVPHLVNWAIQQAITFANHVARVLTSAYRLADSLIDRAWRAATSALMRLLDTLGRWAREQIAQIYRLIPEPIRRAWLLLLDPRRLAEWAASALFFALLRLAQRSAVQIGQWFLGSSPRFTVWLARELERIIVRLI